METEYLFKLTWYDDYRHEEIACNGITFADSWTSAMHKIEHRFPGLITCTIDELDEEDFVFLSDDLYERALHNEYGLEDAPIREDEDDNW